MERVQERDPDLEQVAQYEVLQGPVEIATNTYEIRVAKPAGFTFQPGQSMKFYRGGEERWRTLSIVSAPHEPHLTFAFRAGKSDFKKMLMELGPGSKVHLRAPRGEMVYPEDEPADTPIVMLAGGIGITPFMSMLRHAAHTQDNRNFNLLYANPTSEDTAYRDELAELGSSVSLRTEHYSTKLGRRFNAGDLTRFVSSTPPALFLIAGSETMIAETRAILQQLGIAEDRVRSTKFSNYEGYDDAPPR